jgi:hypothetical protein
MAGNIFNLMKRLQLRIETGEAIESSEDEPSRFSASAAFSNFTFDKKKPSEIKSTDGSAKKVKEAQPYNGGVVT